MDKSARTVSLENIQLLGADFPSAREKNQEYLLLSGRWYSAPSLDGPWQFVPADRLPRDFADIPDNSPKENVKASVPGTPQATEALIANSIPQSTKVARSMQMASPQFDGPPRLEPIQGTSLYYVVNSGTSIIKVDEQSWYACQDGVWFVATSVQGPWTVAASVPAVIYSIPPSSPLHYLTYVQVYGTTPQEVYEGYTPGYLGTEVEDGVVVYGRATITRRGLATPGMAGPALGVLGGGLVGRRGTIGASTMALAGASGLEGMVGGAVTYRRRGGDQPGIGITMAALHGAVTPQVPLAMCMVMPLCSRVHRRN